MIGPKFQMPVSVLPAGSVPPAVQGEPSLPLHAVVFLPSAAVNSDPPCLPQGELDLATYALVTLAPFSPFAPAAPAAPPGPAGPCGPVAPAGPAGPCAPVAPFAPA